MHIFFFVTDNFCRSDLLFLSVGTFGQVVGNCLQERQVDELAAASSAAACILIFSTTVIELHFHHYHLVELSFVFGELFSPANRTNLISNGRKW